MSVLANVVVALVGLLHVYFLVLEMFLWDKPAGLKAFKLTTVAGAYWRGDDLPPVAGPAGPGAGRDVGAAGLTPW